MFQGQIYLLKTLDIISQSHGGTNKAGFSARTTLDREAVEQ